MSNEKRRSRAAPQSLSEEWAPLINLFRGNSRNSGGTNSSTDDSSRAIGSSGQESTEKAERLPESGVRHPGDAHLEPKKLSKHEQGMQGPAVEDAVVKEDRTPSEMEEAVRVDTNDSLSAVRTISRVPGNNTYYEKGGLRTFGDGQDHVHEEPVGCSSIMPCRNGSRAH